MKKLTVVFTIVILATSSLFANGKNPKNSTYEKLRNEIAVLLDNPLITIETPSTEAFIEFTLNNKNEIVILTVDSEKEGIEAYVKSRLNYKKVNLTGNSTYKKNFRISLKILRARN
ncbi:hypothetical protein GCM10022393_37190 [Aquimarina addita]|uniref:Uncharacterized protein n=1 Tax=Aquimarina addita TaxID=870485 RepID=A0ABP6USA3_9FLAO